MKKKNRISPPISPKPGGKIPDLGIYESSIKLSFKYLDLGHKKFAVHSKGGQYFIKLLERLKDFCRFNLLELQSSRSNAIRFHSIKWTKTSEPRGFSHLIGELRDAPAYQFSVSANEYGRVLGFVLYEHFHIVWLDPDHKLYP